LIHSRILVFGYGNPGRQDDGLGPALVDRIEADHISGVVTDSNYQLQVEDALAVSQSDIVVFVDACASGVEPFTFTELEPSGGITFTSHSVSPGSVLALCHDLYGKRVKAFVLAVRGYGWEFVEELTPVARENLNQAYRFIREKIFEFINTDERISLPESELIDNRP
jgi:hydrogenase maturation protease